MPRSTSNSLAHLPRPISARSSSLGWFDTGFAFFTAVAEALANSDASAGVGAGAAGAAAAAGGVGGTAAAGAAAAAAAATAATFGAAGAFAPAAGAFTRMVDDGISGADARFLIALGDGLSSIATASATSSAELSDCFAIAASTAFCGGSERPEEMGRTEQSTEGGRREGERKNAAAARSVGGEARAARARALRAVDQSTAHAPAHPPLAWHPQTSLRRRK